MSGLRWHRDLELDKLPTWRGRSASGALTASITRYGNEGRPFIANATIRGEGCVGAFADLDTAMAWSDGELVGPHDMPPP